MQDIPDGGVKKERDTDYKDPKAAKSFLALTKAVSISCARTRTLALISNPNPMVIESHLFLVAHSHGSYIFP